MYYNQLDDPLPFIIMCYCTAFEIAMVIGAYDGTLISKECVVYMVQSFQQVNPILIPCFLDSFIP